MAALVFSAKSNSVFESSFVRNSDAARYLQETRGERLAGFRKGLVQLVLSGKELTTEQQFHLHRFATQAQQKDARLSKSIVPTSIENVDLFAHAEA